ncbi:MAG: TAXI family TRAP transporter solute-binding subunit [Thermodesulfobacteriota bacterium]
MITKVDSSSYLVFSIGKVKKINILLLGGNIMFRLKKRNWAYIIFGLTITLYLLTPGLAEAAERKGWPKRVTIGSGPLQGVLYAIAASWSTMLNKELNINSSVESTGGTVPNVKLMNAGNLELAMLTTGIAQQGWSGEGYAEGKKHTNIRLIIPWGMSPLKYWTMRKSGVMRVEDIEGKRLNMGRPGSTVDVFMRDLFKITGLKPSQLVNVDHGQANQMLQDGLLDVASAMGPRHPGITSITTELGSKILVFGIGKGDWAKKMLEKYPYFVPMTVAGNTYKGTPEPIETIGELNWFAAGAQMPEDFVYEVVKLTYEKKKDLMASNVIFEDMNASEAKNALIPLHPGAIRYYKEMGIQIPSPAMP